MATKSVGVMAALLDQARAIVSGSRHEAYGLPEENHQRTAEAFNWYMRHTKGRLLDGRDVCNLNMLQKISRDIHWRQTDNMLDIAGYAANGEACEQANGR